MQVNPLEQFESPSATLFADLEVGIGPTYSRRLDEDPALEFRYYRYQQHEAQRLGNTRSIEEFQGLMNMAHRIIDVVARGGIDRELLEARLARVSLGNQASSKDLVFKDSYGEYDPVTGAIHTSEDLPPKYREHAYAHEVTHGVSALGRIEVVQVEKKMRGMRVYHREIRPTGCGVGQYKTLKGERVPDATRKQLKKINEGVTDLFGLIGGGYDPEQYIAEDVGYSRYITGVDRMMQSQPRLFDQVVRGVFGHGLESLAQANRFIAGFEAARYRRPR